MLHLERYTNDIVKHIHILQQKNNRDTDSGEETKVGGGGSELRSDYYMRRRGDQTIRSATRQEGFGTKQVACKDNGALGYGILSRYVEFHYIYI
jgi:hypothetical protein